MNTRKTIFGASAATMLALGLAVAGSTGAYAVSASPAKAETCRDSNFVHVYAPAGTTCYADAGGNSVNIKKPTQVNGGNNNGYVYETDANYYFFSAGAGREGLNDTANATNVTIN